MRCVHLSVSVYLFVTRLPVQLWLISCAMTNANDLSPDCGVTKSLKKKTWNIHGGRKTNQRQTRIKRAR